MRVLRPVNFTDYTTIIAPLRGAIIFGIYIWLPILPVSDGLFNFCTFLMISRICT